MTLECGKVETVSLRISFLCQPTESTTVDIILQSCKMPELYGAYSDMFAVVQTTVHQAALLIDVRYMR